MIKLYAPLGKIIVIDKAGQKKPAILLNKIILDDLPYLEMAVYAAMQFHVCDYGNLEEYYYKKTLTDNAFADGHLDDCLESLHQKGLIVYTEAEEDFRALYQLLAWRNVRLNLKTIEEQVTNYFILRQKHVPIRTALQVFKKPKLTPLEKKIVQNIKDVSNQDKSMYELILALKNKQAPYNFKQQEALFYLQLVDEQQEYISAFLGLLLKKQIIFE